MLQLEMFPEFPRKQPPAIQHLPGDNSHLPEPEYVDDDELDLDDDCPNCGVEYDVVDYEYQICHICKFNNN